MDMFADKLVKKVILDIIENKGELPTSFATWRQMTKCLIREKGILPLVQEMELIVEELADADWFENKYPPEIFKEKKPSRRTYKTNDKLKNLINTKLKITDIAKSYGLDTDKKGITTCPFHYDTDPSLHLDDRRNIFHCFGCGAKGDLTTFYIKLKELKGGNSENDQAHKL